MNRIQLRWQQLLAACLNAPCGNASPAPAATDLCTHITYCILYCSVPAYEKYFLPLCLKITYCLNFWYPGGHGAPGLTHARPSQRMEDVQEYLSPFVRAERAAELRGSPWQLCTGQFSCHANLQNMNVIGYFDSMLFHYI